MAAVIFSPALESSSEKRRSGDQCFEQESSWQNSEHNNQTCTGGNRRWRKNHLLSNLNNSRIKLLSAAVIVARLSRIMKSSEIYARYKTSKREIGERGGWRRARLFKRRRSLIHL